MSLTKVVVKYLKSDPEKRPDEVFEDAEVAITPPGVFVIQNTKGSMAYFPIGEVSIVFPDGPGVIETVH